DTGVLFVNVDNDFFDRLQRLAVLALLHDHARTRYGQFKAFAAHRLDQNRELQLTTTRHVERVLVRRFLDLQRDAAFGFLQKTIADHAAGNLVTFSTCQRRVVDDERHRDSWRIDRLRLHRHADRWITEGV